MSKTREMTRRSVLKSGITSLGTAAVLSKAHAAQKKPGEVRVLFLMGDIWHNAVRMESHWRKVLGVTKWRLMFAQSSRFVTPEVLADTDLFIFARYAGGDSLGWSPDGIVENGRRATPSFHRNRKRRSGIMLSIAGWASFHSIVPYGRLKARIRTADRSEGTAHARPADGNDVLRSQPGAPDYERD